MAGGENTDLPTYLPRLMPYETVLSLALGTRPMLAHMATALDRFCGKVLHHGVVEPAAFLTTGCCRVLAVPDPRQWLIAHRPSCLPYLKLLTRCCTLIVSRVSRPCATSLATTAPPPLLLPHVPFDTHPHSFCCCFYPVLGLAVVFCFSSILPYAIHCANPPAPASCPSGLITYSLPQ